jgi:hypothetical protein
MPTIKQSLLGLVLAAGVLFPRQVLADVARSRTVVACGVDPVVNDEIEGVPVDVDRRT